ncbi:histidine kinase [Carboxylicivirga sp. N1Y90]|uniref:histidine kinase n=1 Tax=Carboxylicivirga fragile TaxID=3417571 RepID=UPI003D32F41B|nr:histidine kinase [Marinilabiliaceae bacterium N1Y90]
MKKEDSGIQKWLRFLLPIPTGILAYLLILLVFDTLDQMGSNFFSHEVLISIILSFILLASQRFFLRIVDKYYPIDLSKTEPEETDKSKRGPSASARILLIPSISVVFSILIITPLVSLYFYFILGLKDFYSELFVFNGVYGIVSVVFAIIHVSTSFMAIQKEIHYLREKELRKNMEHDLRNYKLQINPQLLYDSLEDLISVVKKDKKLADNLVNHLSKTYRYILDTRHLELVSLSEELKNVNSLLYLLNIKHNNSISITDQLKDELSERQIIPGTISTLIMELCKRSIINRYQPLQINLTSNNEHLSFVASNNPKINFEDVNHWDLSLLNKAYHFFSDSTPNVHVNNSHINIHIPLFEIEEE